MPQTLLALLALVLASFVMFNQQRLTLRSQNNMVTDEVELAATGLASEVIEFIGAKSFDEASTPEAMHENGGAVPTGPATFTSGATFGATDRGTAGCNFVEPARTPDCDDVDDVDGIDWTPVEVDLAHGRSLGFEVRTEVYYVDSVESMEPADSPTRHKRVVMDLRSDHVQGDEADGIFRVTRVISYDPVKAAIDYEEAYDEELGGGTTNETAGA